MKTTLTKSYRQHTATPSKNRVGIFLGVTSSCTEVIWSQAPETQQETSGISTLLVSDVRNWLSKDPIGISGGLNQYVFCGNNGVNFVDPWGLRRWGADLVSSIYGGPAQADNLIYKKQSGLITDTGLAAVLDDTYNRVQTAKKWNIVDEATFDTIFYVTVSDKEPQYIYNGNVYLANEVNYIGIGMYEAHRNNNLGWAEFVTKMWKIRYGGASDGTLHWLKIGFDAYQDQKEANCDK